MYAAAVKPAENAEQGKKGHFKTGVQSKNEQFLPCSRPHKGFTVRRTHVRRSRKTRGERRTGQKGPFLDGH